MNMVRERNINDLLKAFVGRHAMPTEVVAEFTDIPLRRVQSHISATPNKPNLTDFFRYCAVLGHTFQQQAFAIYGYKAEKMVRRNGCPYRVLTTTGEVVSSLSSKLSDGEFDHQERFEARPQLLSLVDEASALVASL